MAFVPLLAAVGGGSATAGGLALAGTAASVGSGLMKANATYKAGREEKRQAMDEAAMVEQATRQADLEAREQIRRTRIEQRQFRGAQRAVIAGSGVVGSTGSPLDILGRTAALQELQIQDMARKASADYSAGYARARQIRVAGRAALQGAKKASLGGLIGTAASTVGSVFAQRDQGLFGGRSLIPAT